MPRAKTLTTPRTPAKLAADRRFVRANWQKMTDAEMAAALSISKSQATLTRNSMRLLREKTGGSGHGGADPTDTTLRAMCRRSDIRHGQALFSIRRMYGPISKERLEKLRQGL